MKGKIAQKWKLRMLATTYFFERMKTNINTNQIAMDVTLSWNFSVLFAFALFLGDFDVVWRGVLWWVTYTSHINQVEIPRKKIISNWFEHVTYMCTISLILGRIISPTFEPPKGRIVCKILWANRSIMTRVKCPRKLLKAFEAALDLVKDLTTFLNKKEQIDIL